MGLIQQNPPDQHASFWRRMAASGALGSLLIALSFWGLTTAALLSRQDIMPYRPGQYIRHAIHSRVDFAFNDKDLLVNAQKDARENEPAVYKPAGDTWDTIQRQLKDLPDALAGRSLDELPELLRGAIDAPALALLKQCRQPVHQTSYNQGIDAYIQPLRKLIVLPEDQRRDELKKRTDLSLVTTQFIRIPPVGTVSLGSTFAPDDAELRDKLGKSAAENFRDELQPAIVAATLRMLQRQPTHILDEDATAESQNQAALRVPASRGQFNYKTNQIIKSAGKLDERDWQQLKAEHDRYLQTLSLHSRIQYALGTAAVAALLTLVLCGYVARHQPRVVKNHARGLGIALLMLSMLFVAQFAALGTGPIYLFGLAPTILLAMILAIAYDRRFAAAIAALHGLMVAICLNQGMGFFLILLTGACTCCFLLNDIRTRGKLIEVGGITALAMMLATAAVGAFSLDPVEPLRAITTNCLYAGAAGLSVGFLVLGILPSIEKLFRITTSMTLLELADATQSLLRRLALEAPGTYNHSIQVATLAEAAAEAIGANSLLCRVGSYYHDIGKTIKSDYFCENRLDGQDRHLNLSPNVSLTVILNHVKDGLEMAREHHLPRSIFPFIQQHHGTTLVEFFYHRACTQRNQPDSPPVNQDQYRYPGPKPRTREVAIVMIADVVESACRAIREPTPGRIESLVHDLIDKRMLDGQFGECDLTLHDLELVRKSCVKTLLGIYHGRIAYPALTQPTAASSSSAIQFA